jgi:hypothetical protein
MWKFKLLFWIVHPLEVACNPIFDGFLSEFEFRPVRRLVYLYRNTLRKWDASLYLKINPVRCCICGAPGVQVRQVPVNIPVSEAYCDGCTEAVREKYLDAMDAERRLAELRWWHGE